MEATRAQEAGCPPSEVQRRRVALARLLRMGVSDGAKSSSGEMAAMSELETELALLREENAQLKVERHRPADVGHVIERMRSLRPQSPAEAQAGGPVPPAETQAIAECLAMREGLMEACQEVERAMKGIRGRLGALAGDIHSRVEVPARSDGGAAAPAETVESKPSAMAETAPALAQSVA